MAEIADLERHKRKVSEYYKKEEERVRSESLS